MFRQQLDELVPNPPKYEFDEILALPAPTTFNQHSVKYQKPTYTDDPPPEFKQMEAFALTQADIIDESSSDEDPQEIKNRVKQQAMQLFDKIHGNDHEFFQGYNERVEFLQQMTA